MPVWINATAKSMVRRPRKADSDTANLLSFDQFFFFLGPKQKVCKRRLPPSYTHTVPLFDGIGPFRLEILQKAVCLHDYFNV
jgi:hypothetical protein